MPCIAEFAGHPKPPTLELAVAFAEGLYEAKSKEEKATIDLTLERAVATARKLFANDELVTIFTSALPTWAGI